MFKIMKAIKFIIGFLFILIYQSAGAQDILNNYLEAAAKNNPAVKAKFSEYMASLEIVPQVGKLPDPQMALGYFIQPVEIRLGPQRFKFSLSQMFPWFGTLEAKENSAIQMAKAKYEIFEETKSWLFNEVRSTYYNLYFTRKAIEITSENIEILKLFQKLALIKVEAGIVSAVDEYRIEIETGDLIYQLELLKDKFNVLQIMFNNLLNAENSQRIELPDTLWDKKLEIDKQSIIEKILSKNHQLIRIDYQLESLKFKEEVAKNTGKPNFTVGIDYIIVGKGNNNLAGKDAFVFPKVGISIPLYRDKYKAMVKEVVYLEAAKQSEKLDKINILETIFENAWKDYCDAQRRISLYVNQTDLAEKSIVILETEHKTGNKNFEEILRMERKLLKYSLESVKAVTDKQAAISFINYLMAN